MPAKVGNISFEQLLASVQAKKFKPVYLLMGEEPFYIDVLTQAIIDNALNEDEKDFGLTVLYGNDTNINNIINAARAYPMGSEHNVVVVKEAQNLKNLENLDIYLQNLQMSTILIIAHKNKSVDKRKKIVSQIGAIGAVFESPMIKDYQLQEIVENFVKQKGYEIDHKSSSLIVESIGSNIGLINSTIDRLVELLPKGINLITPEIVQTNVGISKDFNVYELQDALVMKNKKKCYQIAKYFDNNPKDYSAPKVIASLYGFYSNIMTAYYSPDKTEMGLSKYMGQEVWKIRKNILPAMKNYSPGKVLQILNMLQEADEKSKGVNGANLSTKDILTPLIFYILN